MDENKAAAEVLVLEDDSRSIPLIEEALKEVAPNLKVRAFPSLDLLQKYLTTPLPVPAATPVPAPATAPAPPPANNSATPASPAAPAAIPAEAPAAAPAKPPIRMAILKIEQLGKPEDTELFASFLQTYKAPDAPDLPIVVTSFLPSEKVLLPWSKPFIFNLIHQPFDPALLRQHLRLALQHEKPSSESSVHNMKTSARIEILKSIPMEGLSEVGFITRSDRPVPIKKVTKFYGKVFGWKNLISVFARSQEERAHPTAKGERQMLLTWFGATRDQLLQIRSRFPKKGDAGFNWRAQVPETPVHFLVIGDPSSAGSELSGTLNRTFPTAKTTIFAGLPDQKETIPAGVTGIFVNKDLLSGLDADPRLKEIPRILLTISVPTDEELRTFSNKAIDLVTLPTERVAFFKRVSVLFPQLKSADDLAIMTYLWTESLDVGQPVELVEMSEAGLVIRYERDLPVGTFRRFVLWQPMEAGLPILTGRCYLTQPDTSKPGTFITYFAYFGMSDHEIKHVRLWMLDNYIQAKSKNPS
jgi:hypothetical protein